MQAPGLHMLPFSKPPGTVLGRARLMPSCGLEVSSHGLRARSCHGKHTASDVAVRFHVLTLGLGFVCHLACRTSRRRRGSSRAAVALRAQPPNQQPGQEIDADCEAAELYAIAKAATEGQTDFSDYAKSLRLQVCPAKSLIRAIEEKLRIISIPDVRLVLMGSALNDTQIKGSDFDYYADTGKQVMDTKDWEKLCHLLKEAPEINARSVTGPPDSRPQKSWGGLPLPPDYETRAINIETDGGIIIQIVPRRPENWDFEYPGVRTTRGSKNRVEADLAILEFYNEFPGARYSAIMAKRFMKGCDGLPSCYLESFICHVADNDRSYNSDEDHGGKELFRKAMEILAGYPRSRKDTGIRSVLNKARNLPEETYRAFQGCYSRMAERANIFFQFWDTFERTGKLMENEFLVKMKNNIVNHAQHSKNDGGGQDSFVQGDSQHDDGHPCSPQQRPQQPATSATQAPSLPAAANEAPVARHGAQSGVGDAEMERMFLNVLRTNGPLRPRDAYILAHGGDPTTIRIPSPVVKDAKRILYGMKTKGLVDESNGIFFARVT